MWHIVRGSSDLSLVIAPEETVHRMSTSPVMISDVGYNRIHSQKVRLLLEDFLYLYLCIITVKDLSDITASYISAYS